MGSSITSSLGLESMASLFMDHGPQIQSLSPLIFLTFINVIAKVLANRLLKVSNSIVSEVQTAYIQSRKIIDGPLIVNEILAWATKKKECLFILKVDFEKAFDSLDWSFLDHVMCQMGFSSKRRTWIHGCLNSAYASVIVNGPLTKEFKIQKGLRQGDPLSPFLFIIAMEAFHVTIQEAKANNIFEGIQVGYNNVDVSHLQFADDALIMGKWSIENAKNICRILRCFHMSSGLKVNFSKSKFFGIGVLTTDTNNFASFLNFQPSSLLCIYLGLPIGANMNRGCGGLGINSTSYTLQPSPWKWIIGLDKCLNKLNIDLHNIIKRKTGDGSQTSFWNDNWIGDQCLKTLFPRLFSLESTRDCKVMDRYYLDNGSTALK
ncbi:putative RNA-directed DNA polymerase, eukaryota, reverse transcriptase zinc-binding domain protein [Tanacetum coccineum]